MFALILVTFIQPVFAQDVCGRRFVYRRPVQPNGDVLQQDNKSHWWDVAHLQMLL